MGKQLWVEYPKGSGRVAPEINRAVNVATGYGAASSLLPRPEGDWLHLVFEDLAPKDAETAARLIRRLGIPRLKAHIYSYIGY